VSGATTLALTDGSVVAGVLYGYRIVYTDSVYGTGTGPGTGTDVADSVTSNSVTAQMYPGGAISGGTNPYIGLIQGGG
jgi:hypothetical protein